MKRTRRITCAQVGWVFRLGWIQQQVLSSWDKCVELTGKKILFHMALCCDLRIILMLLFGNLGIWQPENVKKGCSYFFHLPTIFPIDIYPTNLGFPSSTWDPPCWIFRALMPRRMRMVLQCRNTSNASRGLICARWGKGHSWWKQLWLGWRNQKVGAHLSLNGSFFCPLKKNQARTCLTSENLLQTSSPKRQTN